MKVLLVSNMYPSESFPSYGVFVKNFEQGLINNGITIEKIIIQKELSKVKKIKSYIKFYYNIVKRILLREYDIVYVHYASHCSLPIYVSSLLKQFKLIVNVHGSDVVNETKIQKILQIFVKKVMKKATKVVVPSVYFKKQVKEKYHVCEENIFISASGGVNREIFSPSELKESILNKLNLDQNKKYIGYVGRVDRKKGWSIFLDSMERLQKEGFLENKMIIIVGNGKEFGLMKNKIRELDLLRYIVHFDLLPQIELKNIYNILDIFCFPTLGESLGLVALEAMSCGVPVIGSNNTALPEYISDGKTGYLFEEGNSKILAEKFEKYFYEINREEARNLYMNECIKVAREYDSKKVESELIDFLNEVCFAK